MAQSRSPNLYGPHRVRTVLRAWLVVASVALTVGAGRAAAQGPTKFENLKVFPKDIPRDSLIQIMRGFSTALGVKCTYCHVSAPAEAPPAAAGANGAVAAAPPGPPRERILFPYDDKPAKNKARFMLHMVDTLNHVTLAALPDHHNPPVVVSCVTCHHGSPVPATLATVLNNEIDKFGTDSAVKRYNDLRADMVSGRFDFSEGSINDFARDLAARGKTSESLSMLALNQRFYPNSADIDSQMGDVYLKAGDKAQAIVRYKMALTKRPTDQRLKQHLQELGATPPG